MDMCYFTGKGSLFLFCPCSKLERFCLISHSWPTALAVVRASLCVASWVRADGDWRVASRGTHEEESKCRGQREDGDGESTFGPYAE